MEVDEAPEAWKRTSVSLPQQTVVHLERLRREWGLKHRGAVLERLLQQVFGDGELDTDDLPDNLTAVAERLDADGELDEQASLVLIGRDALEPLALEEANRDAGTDRSRSLAGGAGGGIDLPGFVQKRTSKLKRDLGPTLRTGPALSVAPLQVSAELIQQALQEARDHWITVYGQPPNATVLENAMIWLAHDIWPQSDQSEGRLFTWSAACELMRDNVPEWSEQPPVLSGCWSSPACSRIPLVPPP